MTKLGKDAGLKSFEQVMYMHISYYRKIHVSYTILNGSNQTVELNLCKSSCQTVKISDGNSIKVQVAV